MSGTICIYHIATKANSQLTPLEFREQFYAHFSAGHGAKKPREQAEQKAMGCLALILAICSPAKEMAVDPE